MPLFIIKINRIFLLKILLGNKLILFEIQKKKIKIHNKYCILYFNNKFKKYIIKT